MERQKFKVGDKVRIKSCRNHKSCAYLYVDKVGEVTDYWPHNVYGKYHIYVVGGFNDCFYEDELEPVEVKINMEKIDKAIEILQAFKEGKRVDFKLKEDSSDNWTPAWNLSKDERMNFSRYDFKIYEEPTYRPYANALEVIKAGKEHGPYVCVKNSEEYYIPLTGDNVGVYVSTMNDRRELLSFDCLFNDFDWQDGTPCGVLEIE